MPPDISFQHIHFSYPDLKLFSALSLTIEQGEFVGIIGPNGGGKTTLLRLIMGLLLPQEGTISVLGKAPAQSSHNIGYVPQERSLDKTFPISVEELVLLGALSKANWYGKYPQEVKEKAHHLLEMLGLIDFRQKSFGALSGGQAQRALIARGLVHDPSILILDEPTSNIDFQTEEKIFELLLSLKGKITILLVSHDLNVIINKVTTILSVNKNAEKTLPKEVCEHFALGLYHHPLVDKDNDCPD